MNVRDRIAARRRERIAAEGHALGARVPDRRMEPLVPFGRPPFLIAEVKRRSPSRGDLAAQADPVAQAGAYRAQGVRSVSVLTEEDHFAGSLGDLLAIKQAFPDLAVLRKDFLLDDEDVEVSHRAGADAVLLIASLLAADELCRLAARARDLGMAALVEVHSAEDAAKARACAPEFTGINSRDLETFAIDPVLPLRVKTNVDWPTKLVYESGIFSAEDAALALSSGFSGILVGEALMRDPGLGRELVTAFSLAAPDFWGRLYSRPGGGKRPLVKVCGITNREDALLAAECGADIIGFILAPSPRRTDAAFIRSLADVGVLKAGVVVAGPEARPEKDVVELLSGGFIQAVQFHGDEEPGNCYSGAFPYYKAVRIRDGEDVAELDRFHCPRVLIDAYASDARGGTGRRIDPELVAEVASGRPLWLAGGIGPDNIGEIVERFRPELVDPSTRLEAAPGKKDPSLVKEFFRNLENAVHS
ncbi:MAG: bifunctional indole-3-glycerol phosphate synthase/phosphoribosylanthranilate isomerase [Spirochaetales bacterium]|nr:bifunctional indole-3-glycerol phosphate synthase/phosphoribosylanthranilate isomerase [Spirochaetales bacterium]